MLVALIATMLVAQDQPSSFFPDLGPIPSSHCGMHPDGAMSTAEEGEIQMRLVGIDWTAQWHRLCRDIVKAAEMKAPPYDDHDLERFSDVLRRLGYFEGVRCSVDHSRMRMSCDLTQAEMVHSTSVSGNLPWSILRVDVKQRLYLKPGALLDPEHHGLDRQQQRVHDYLQAAGYFDADIRVDVTPESGAEPNFGVHVNADISRGHSYRLGKITINGTPLFTEDQARSYLTHYWLPFVRIHFQPDTFEADLDRIARRLQKRGWPEARVKGHYEFDDSTQLANITLEVKSGPIVRTSFTGKVNVSDGDLLDESTFEEAQSVDAATAEDMADKIRERYQRDGYYDAKVESRLRSVSHTVAEADFAITEGPKAVVTRVVYSGNDTFDAKTLKKSAGLLVDSSHRWVYAYSDHDIAALKEYYRTQGFARAEVSTSVQPIADGELEVDFDIVEGPRRTVESSNIVGLPDSPNAKLVQKRIKENNGAPYVEEEAEADKRLITALLAADGYPRATVDQHIEGPSAEAGGSMKIYYIVKPNKRSTYGGVLLRGNFRTRHTLLDEELGLKPGDPLDVTAVGAATRRLRSLGIFSSVQLTPLDDYAGGETWMLAQLQERPSVRVDGSVSFSTLDAFQVGTDISDRNVLGRAIQFSLRVRWGNANDALNFLPSFGRMDEAIATLRAPRPLGLPFDLIYSASYVYENRGDFDQLISNGTALPPSTDLHSAGDYDERRVRGAVAIAKTLLQRGRCTLCPLITGSFNYELSGITTWYEQGRVTANFGRFYPLIALDARDSPTDPRRGYYLETRVELAERPFGLILENPQSFWRWITRLSTFIPLGHPFQHPHPKEDFAIGGPLILAMTGTYGIGSPIGADYGKCNLFSGQLCQLPPSETFAYGGDFSLRGLRLRESFDGTSDATSLFNGTVELRYYMFQDLGFGTLQVAAFVDYGSVANRTQTLFADQTVSTGPAIRYVTPVGPLSIAYGKVIHRSQALSQYDASNGISHGEGRLVFGFGYSF